MLAVVSTLVAIVGFYLAMWLIIMFVASRFGWALLARRFPGSDIPNGPSRQLRFQSISFTLANYTWCVSITLTRDGMRLQCAPQWAFPFHRPIYLPWNAVEIVRVTEGRFIKCLLVDVGRPPIARIRLPWKVLEVAEELRSQGRSSPESE